MQEEIWKDIPEYERTLSSVKSLNYLGHGKEMLKKPSLQKKSIMKQGGYYQIQL